MCKIFVIPPVFLILGVVIFIGCRNGSEPRTNESPEDAPSSCVEASSDMGYPRLSEKYVEADGSKMEGASSFLAGDNPKTLSILEDSYRKLMTYSNPEYETAFAVELSPDNSLEIRLPARATDDRKEPIAIWRRPEKEDTGVDVVVVRQSEPLENDEQALAVLKSFASLNGEFESSVKWEVIGRSTSVPID
jgi:hypothetical protein